MQNNLDEKKKHGIFEFFSTKDVLTTKSIVIMSLMAALAVVLNQFTIYVTPTFKAVSFSYLPGVIVAMLYGPWAALFFGFAVDTIKFLASSHGFPYFFGYALSEMVTYFIYACFLYKMPVKNWRICALRVALARLFVILIVVFGLNYYWNVMQNGTLPAAYFTGVRLINNTVQFPFHVALTTTVAVWIPKLLLQNNIDVYGKIRKA